jgi:hypothetical protein
MKNDYIRINKECSASEIAERILNIKTHTKENYYNKNIIKDILKKKLSNNEFNVIMELINNSNKNNQ